MQQTLSAIDSDFQWIQQPLSGCHSVLFTFSGTQITKEQTQEIKKVAEGVTDGHVYYPSTFDSLEGGKNLSTLANADLSEVNPLSLSSYVFLFDAQLLTMVTPVNFAFMTMYTVEEMLLMPTLILAQSAKTLFETDAVLHSVNGVFGSSHLFSLAQPPAQKDKKSVCFVSAPSNPFAVSREEFLSHSKSIVTQKTDIRIWNIVYLPYAASPPFDYISALKELKAKNVNTKLRFTLGSAKLPHGAYESVYNFCPHKSLIATSRHNVRFQNNFAQRIFK